MKPLLVLALLLGCTYPAEAKPVPANLAADAVLVETAYGALGTQAPTAGVVQVACDEENAFYNPKTDEVTICTELLPEGDDVVVLALAHELAHAVMYEQGLAEIDAEDAADELAGLVLLNAGDRDAVVHGADFLRRLFPGSPGDEHSYGFERERELLCLDDGFDGANAADANCAMYYRHALASWQRLLATVLESRE